MSTEALRVLIVDDEPIARQRLAGMVSDAGHQVIGQAAEAIGARDAITREAPDLVLLDVEMPGESGMELAAEIGSQRPDLMVILVTAHDQFSLEAFEAGVRDYVLKPVRGERLTQALERAARHKARPSAPAPRTVRLTIGRREERVSLDRIAYFTAEDGYVIARGEQLEGFVDTRLHELESRFGEALLCVRRGCLVVRMAIRGLETRGPADHRLLFHGNVDPVAVSRRQLPQVRAFLRGDRS
ncbi:LytTR family DNA-binding domain-containing protein [Thioalkalivibrio sp. HL-Eb18]|jgi:two-component system response regulator AlgR|uniref:LytR/AlgR family response regulator transcription factor n=1 Tax=Thioalkalivibrio sp. HL-Eb18 TaxID=1266913 RepID=UPI0003812A5E|nr:LytTR family DNA-binding domain-containing protein [Thioalkalivibrio sp. HL-Eb18]